ncbi:MAG: DUF6384 family protein [Flavobacteriaceae bacterium]
MAQAAAAVEGADTARPLDEVMLAMDVVDTLRHRELLIVRELAGEDRDAALIERLREIYAGQGIEVSDEILKEGVKALSEERFAYRPKGAGLSRTLARVYIARGRVGLWAGGIIAALVLLWLGWQAAFVWPAERAEEAARIERTESLPRELQTYRQSVIDIARDPAAADGADELFADGTNALKRGDVQTAREAVDRLAQLDGLLRQEYRLRIVQEQGEQSGVWRIPDANERASNYYLIVDAVDANGGRVSLPVTSEETNRRDTVSRFGVRVSEQVFDGVRRDKADDGIIQNNIVAVKERGYMEPEYRMPVLGGAITEW